MRVLSLITAVTLAAASMAQANSLHSVDSNGDGRVSYLEYFHVYGPDAGPIKFGYADTDNDGSLNWVEFNSVFNND